MWRSHTDQLSYSEEENRALGDAVADAGGEVLLDQRIRWAGSHHQKLVVARHPRPGRDVAFVGGIDLCRSRRDDADHQGDPQPLPMSAAYGERPPWHDVQLEVRGPAVAVLDAVFRERWEDPHSLDLRHPIARLRDMLGGADLVADPLPPRPAEPPAAGDALVQVLRTYPAIWPGYPFAPRGERSVARGFTKALGRARRLVYLEDQYMWSPISPAAGGRPAPQPPAAPRRGGAAPLRRGRPLEAAAQPGGQAPGDPGVPHGGTGPGARVRPGEPRGKPRLRAREGRGHGRHVGVRRQRQPQPRSWSHDSELSAAVLDTERDGREPADPGGHGDGARRFARDLRLALVREHLDRVPDEDDDLLDPARFVRAVEQAAAHLDAWHACGRRGPRPPGRLRAYHPERMGLLTRAWAAPAYRLVYDPDGARGGTGCGGGGKRDDEPAPPDVLVSPDRILPGHPFDNGGDGVVDGRAPLRFG